MDGYADWCGPCKIMAPVLDDFARERQGEVLVVKLDTDRNPATTHRFGIRAIPTLIVFRQGREMGRQAGAFSGIGRAHGWTPVTVKSRMPPSSFKKKEYQSGIGNVHSTQAVP